MTIKEPPSLISGPETSHYDCADSFTVSTTSIKALTTLLKALIFFYIFLLHDIPADMKALLYLCCVCTCNAKKNKNRQT